MRSTPCSPTTAFSSPSCPEPRGTRWAGHPSRLLEQSHRATRPSFQFPLDQWSSRANESHLQRGYRPALSREDHQQLRDHLAAFLDAYEFGKRSKLSQGLTLSPGHLQSLDGQPLAIQVRFNPPHIGTEHLARRVPLRFGNEALSIQINV